MQKGLSAHGVKSLNVYQVGDTNELIMNIDFYREDGKSLGEALGPGSEYRNDPKCKHWEEWMQSDFTGGWTELKNIHSSQKHWTALNE